MVMDKSKAIEALNEGVVVVEFTKVNGEYRKMEATLKADMLPEVVKEIEEKAAPRKKNEDALSVWDINANGWRSFRWDKLQTVNGEVFANG
jgi:hypothetical protein